MLKAPCYLALLIGALCVAACNDGQPQRTYDGSTGGVVTVYSTTDTAIFDPVIADFRKLHPDINLNYVELDAQPLFDRFLHETESREPTADIVLSSAMDLQVKLVNDGLAQKHRSENSDALPPWAKWRNEIFGLTFEPVVMVANPALFSDRTVPRTRFDLVLALRSNPAFWRGRIGTYDIAKSSVGYLLAAQDVRQSSEFGALVEAMGEAKVRTYQNVSVLIDDIEAGKVALGYNVLGSYAQRRVAQGANIKIIFPEDYTLAIVRAAFVAKDAPNPEGAHVFLEYLMSIRGQRILTTRSYLAAVREEVRGPNATLDIKGAVVGPLRPITIGPGLMTYLDKQKRERFIANWQTALGAPH
jgi:iron(III) transport system substrate-binding protein